jgi:hypothetical protein
VAYERRNSDRVLRKMIYGSSVLNYNENVSLYSSMDKIVAVSGRL